MPQINLPDGTPPWLAGVVAVVVALAVAIRLLAGAVLPKQSAHRLTWWREWWKRHK
ncbi:hypothetical protein [Kitasatospora sp. NPDC001547]|uniref:hypothetical protein n=1 Tax=Kitasatospora sp. NPDC001547 TaxID=3364015 RepID=UPI0036ACAABC|nr:hypothetical protein KitaXyl93_64810 [Kitasatospora sp. Xyl93]